MDEVGGGAEGEGSSMWVHGEDGWRCTPARAQRSCRLPPGATRDEVERLAAEPAPHMEAIFELLAVEGFPRPPGATKAEVCSALLGSATVRAELPADCIDCIDLETPLHSAYRWEIEGGWSTVSLPYERIVQLRLADAEKDPFRCRWGPPRVLPDLSTCERTRRLLRWCGVESHETWYHALPRNPEPLTMNLRVSYALPHPGVFRALTVFDAEGALRLLSTYKVDTRAPAGLYEETMLMQAAYTGATRVVDALLARPETEVNAVDKGGVSSLMWAVMQGRTECVSRLLAHPEIDALAASKRGNTALHLAAVNDIEVIRLLLSRDDVHLDSLNREGFSPVGVALRAKHTTNSAIRLLVSSPGFSATQVAGDGLAPLHLAARYGRASFLKILLERCAVDTLSRGTTALHHAAYWGYVECARILIRAGARCDIEDGEGKTAAQTAQLGGKKSDEMLALLGAEPA